MRSAPNRSIHWSSTGMIGFAVMSASTLSASAAAGKHSHVRSASAKWAMMCGEPGNSRATYATCSGWL